jgi:tetratricopeptide (TPR) repeat protein
VLVGWLWYLGTLVPTIGIVQVGTQAMADRYSYLPLIGLFIVLAWALHDFTDGHPNRRRSAFISMGALLVLLTAVTRRQVGYWESSQALWTHALAVTSDNYAAHTYLGNALASAGDIDGAIAHYSEALRIRPDFPEAHNNLGPALATQGKTDAAISHFRAAIQLRPNYADAHNNLGVTLATQGKLGEAIAEYREVLRIDPDHPHAHGNLGLALKAQGDTAEALRELSLALAMNPSKQDVRAALDDLRRQTRQP